MFFIAGVAETHRSPFDLPEADSELVAGYHSEYSGMKFGMFLVGEYLSITLISAMIAILFFGGWQGPLLPPVVWFLLKTFVFIALFILLRATLPRPRYDQLMALGWKVLLPLSLLNLLVTGAAPVVRWDEERNVLSILKGLWIMLTHTFRRRVTVQYPEVKPYMPPRYRGRIILTRDPDGGGALRGVLPVFGGLPGGLHRAAGDGGRKRPTLPGILPDQFLALHLLRVLRGGLPDLRHPAHAGFRDGRVRAPEPGVREGAPAHQRSGKISRLQFLPRGRAWRSAAKARARRETKRPPSTCTD